MKMVLYINMLELITMKLREKHLDMLDKTLTNSIFAWGVKVTSDTFHKATFYDCFKLVPWNHSALPA